MKNQTLLVKSLLGILLMSMLTTNVNGQGSVTTVLDDVITGFPQNSQSFLIWQNDEAQADYWDVTIMKRTFGPDSLSGFTDTKEKTYEVWDDSHLRIDKMYWNNNSTTYACFVVLEGRLRDGTLVAKQSGVLETGLGHIGEPTVFTKHSWGCVGPNFAYQIDLRAKYTNEDQGFLTLQPLYVYDDNGVAIDHYMYFDQTLIDVYTDEFNYPYTPGGLPSSTDCQTDTDGDGVVDCNDACINDPDPNCEWQYGGGSVLMNPLFHGIAEWGVWNNDNQDRFLQFNQYDENYIGIYDDYMGNVIFDNTVWALTKYTGWWRQHSLRMPWDANAYINISNFTTYDLSTVLDLINSEDSNLEWWQDMVPEGYPDYHPNSYPDVQCLGGLSGSGIMDSFDESFYDCLYDGGYYDIIDDWMNDGSTPGNIWELFNLVTDCSVSTGTGGTGGTGPNNPEYAELLCTAEFVTLNEIGENGETNLGKWEHDDIVSVDGEFNQLNAGVLDPGLYKIIFKFPGHGISHYFVELDDRVQTVIPLKDFLNVLAYPNPVIDDYSFDLDMSTSVALDFTFQLFDSQMNVLHRQDYKLAAAHDESHKVSLSNALQSGVYIGKFDFEDGSTKSITLIK